jgi:menaquinol-cytochrome c reductase iron-sulfur subunit
MSSGDPEPIAGAEEQRRLRERRRFLTLLSLGAGAVGLAFVGLPVLSFVLAPLFRRVHEDWRAVGAVDSFPIGKTVEVTFRDATDRSWSGATSMSGAWLRRVDEQRFIVFALNCTHLGCPVRWVPDAELFMCPCHGGVYYKDGKVAAGPPPRALSRYEVRVRNGNVEVRTMPVPIT